MKQTCCNFTVSLFLHIITKIIEKEQSVWYNAESSIVTMR